MALEDAWEVLKAPAREAVPNIDFVTWDKQGGEEKPEDIHGGFKQMIEEEPLAEGQDLSEIRQMTPRQFLATAGTRGMEPRKIGFYLDPMRRAVKEGKKVRLNMPRIGVGYEHLGLPPSVFHDGRHRMLALLRLGHGDTPVPVHVNDMQEFETGEKWQPPEDPWWLEDWLEHGTGMG